jgi:hypothetical protein
MGDGRGMAMDSRLETKNLIVVMAVIVAFYLLGRWVAEGWPVF